MPISTSMLWELVRNQHNGLVKSNGIVLSKEKGNLTNKHNPASCAYANNKNVSVEVSFLFWCCFNSLSRIFIYFSFLPISLKQIVIFYWILNSVLARRSSSRPTLSPTSTSPTRTSRGISSSFRTLSIVNAKNYLVIQYPHHLLNNLLNDALVPFFNFTFLLFFCSYEYVAKKGCAAKISKKSGNLAKNIRKSLARAAHKRACKLAKF